MKSKKGFGSRPKGVSSPDQVFISAGEASGDLHGSMFMRELKALVPGIGFVGMGGAAMEAMGLKKLVDMKHVSVVGITEVLGRLMGILRAQRMLRAALINTRPKLMVLIDFPDFHMSLLGLKEKIGCRILYLIPPQVWAWRAGRIKRLKRYVDSLAVILPFEEKYYRSKGLKAEYIGHPLVELYPQAFSEKRDGRIIGVLPGSRVHEVKRNLPVIYKALLLAKERLPDIRAMVSISPTVEPSLVRNIMGKEEWISFEYGVKEILKNASVCCVVSGTATLEAALMGVPMVVVYRLSPFSYSLGKRLSRVEFISLVNLILGEGLVRELIQGDANPKNISHELISLLTEPHKRERMLGGFMRVRERLFEGIRMPPSRRAALMAQRLLEGI